MSRERPEHQAEPADVPQLLRALREVLLQRLHDSQAAPLAREKREENQVKKVTNSNEGKEKKHNAYKKSYLKESSFSSVCEFPRIRPCEEEALTVRYITSRFKTIFFPISLSPRAS